MPWKEKSSTTRRPSVNIDSLIYAITRLFADTTSSFMYLSSDKIFTNNRWLNFIKYKTKSRASLLLKSGLEERDGFCSPFFPVIGVNQPHFQHDAKWNRNNPRVFCAYLTELTLSCFVTKIQYSLFIEWFHFIENSTNLCIHSPSASACSIIQVLFLSRFVSVFLASAHHSHAFIKETMEINSQTFCL